MVRAIIQNEKSQTRRIAKDFNDPDNHFDGVYKIALGEFIGCTFPHTPNIELAMYAFLPGIGVVSPYGIWVIEFKRILQ